MGWLGSSTLGNAQLVADFTADPPSGCAPIRVVFTDKSSGSPTRYRWDLGNGTIADQKNPSTIYLLPGMYTVKLTIYKGNDSATVTKTNFIAAYAIPNVNFDGSPLSGCVPLPVQFQDKSQAGSGTISNWQWDFGDGNIGSGQNPQHTYDARGLYRVTLTVKNSFGCTNSASRVDYVNANDSLLAKFGYEVPPTCTMPITVKFTDSSRGSNIRSWLWDFGDGSTSTQRNPLHTYRTPGTYTVGLVVTNSTGCVDTLIRVGIITVQDFTADFRTSALSICLGRPVAFINTSTFAPNLDSVVWRFSDGTVSRSINIIKTFTTPGNHTVTMMAYAHGCSDTLSKSLTVNTGPKADFDANVTGACIPPLSVTFRNLTPGGTVLRWDFGNGTSTTAPNPTVVYDSYGSFDVSMIVTNANGCQDTLVKPGFINLSQPKILGIKGLPWAGCFPHTHNFDLDVNSPDPIVKWEWDFGDGTGSTERNPSKTFTVPKVYDIRAIITTAQGCADTIVKELKGGHKPKTNFKGEPLLVCPEDEVYFTDQSTGNIDDWFWQFGDGGTSREPNPAHQYNDTGWMPVILITSQFGCGDTLVRDKYVYVNPPLSIFKDSFSCSTPTSWFFTEKAIGATFWLWKFGDGDSSTSPNVSHVYQDTGRFQVSLTVGDSACEHTSSKIVFVLDEKANIETVDSGSCTSTVKHFYARGPRTHPGNIISYEWTFDNEPPLVTDTNWVARTYTQPQTVKVKLKITDINGCTDSTVQDIPVRFYGPKANFGPIYQAACAGSIVTLSDSTHADANNPILKWTWHFGNDSIKTFTSPPFSMVYQKAGFYNVKLVVEDSQGCRDSLSRRKAVGIYDPVADFASADTLVCINAPVVFDNKSYGAKLRYFWDFGNGKTDTLPSPLTRYPKQGFYDVRLIVTDSVQCRDTLLRTQYIEVGNAIAAFAASDTFTTCPPLVVNFSNKSQFAQSSYWNFGNGNTSTLTSPSHTYTLPGVFKAKLVVTGNGGCKDSAVQTIRIQGPVGNIRYGPLGGCPPFTVDFASTAINTKYYTWDFSDGQSDFTTDSTTTHTYLLPGTYVPRLILEDGLGCKLPVPGPDTIRVYGAKALIKKVQRLAYCDTASVAFFDSTITTDVVVRYRWQFGDGTTSNEQNPVHFYARPGRYRAILEVWTANNCYTADTLPIPISVSESPQVDFSMPSPVCVPATVPFSSTWLNPDTTTLNWKWDFGNGLSSNQVNPVAVNYLLPGTFTVKLAVVDNYGCTDSVMKPLVVNDTPTVSASPYTYLCLGDQVRLQASGAIKYRWDANASLSCLDCPNPVAKPGSQQIFRVVGSDANGCTASDTVLVKVKMPGKLSFSPGDTICVGESLQLRSDGFEMLRWSPPTGLSSVNVPNPVAKPTVTTTYTVRGTDSLGCFADSGKVTVVVYPIPQFNIVETVIKAEIGTQVVLKTSSSADISRWRWTPPIGLDCNNCPEPTASVGGATMEYQADASNEGGCTVRDKVTLVPVCMGENLFVPNTFSPNADGRNDVFYPRGKGLASVKSLRIFNRWGEVMYERKDFALNDPSAGWDGTHKGVLVTADVYVYIMDVLCANNEIFSVKGNVTLLR